MFSDELRVQIFADERMHAIPVNHQVVVIRVIEDMLERRYYTENPDADREDILQDICEQ